MGKRISQLDAAGPLTGAELVPIVQSSRTKQTTLNTLQDFTDLSCQCTLVNRFAQVGNAANTLEQFLHTYQMPGNTLSSAGSYIDIFARGEFATNNDAKLVTIYFGTTSFVGPAGGGGADENNKGWEFNIRVSRMTATTQQMTGIYMAYPRSSVGASVGTIFPKGSPTENLANVIPIKLSVQAGGGTLNDILVNDFIINLHKVDADS